MDTEQRTHTIIAMRDDGHTLESIGQEIGVSREWIRRILQDNGLRTMTHTDRLNAAAEQWRASGQLRHAADVAREHGLAPHGGNLAALRKACPDLSLPDVKGGGSLWDTDAVVGILRRMAAEHGIDPATGWMRIADYTAWRHDGDPSTASIGANYTWSTLMTLAGFDVGNAGHRGRQPGVGYLAFSDADLDAAVMAYMDSKPARLSAVGMEHFLAGRPGMPSMATVRNRFRKKGQGSISGIFEDVTARSRTA